MTQTINKPVMMSARQIAKSGLLPQRTIYNLINTGRLPYIVSGRTKYVNYSALIQMLNDGIGSIFEEKAAE